MNNELFEEAKATILGLFPNMKSLTFEPTMHKDGVQCTFGGIAMSLRFLSPSGKTEGDSWFGKPWVRWEATVGDTQVLHTLPSQAFNRAFNTYEDSLANRLAAMERLCGFKHPVGVVYE